MNNLPKRLVLFIAILTASCNILAQDYNYAGIWSGTANWGLQKFVLSIELHHKGDSLFGEIFTETHNQKKFAKYVVNGVVSNGVARVNGTKYISKNGIWCLPGIELSSNGNFDLVGKWKANPILNGCIIAGAGRIDLTRKVDITSPVAEQPVNRAVHIANSDSEGNTLASELQKRNYYALIIAVQDYKDASIVDLGQPIQDAWALRNELIADYTFKPNNITLLQNPSRGEIIEIFDQLTVSVKNTDNLLVFYAGHGIWDDKIEQGYWLPSNAKKSSKAAWLSNGTIRDYIRAIDSKHTLLITDACFSGGILKTREAFTASKAILEMYKLSSRRAITSGSLKTVPDKSVFIEYLIKALKNNEQPLISADQLFNSFKYNVINNSVNGQVPQYGVISQSNDEGGEFIFLKK